MDRRKRNGTGKNRKAFVSMALACLLALQTMLVPSAAADTAAEDTEAVQEWDSYKEFTLCDRNTAAEEQPALFSETLLEKLYYANTFTGSTYGDQIRTLEELTEAEREDSHVIYEALCKIDWQTAQKINSEEETLTIEVPNGIVIESAEPLTDEQETQIKIYIHRIFQTAADAFLRDCPEKFWFSLNNGNEIVDDEDTSFTYQETTSHVLGKYTATVNKINVNQVGVTSAYSSGSGYEDRFEAAVKSIEVDEKDRYSKVKSIHDWLVEHNVYDLTGTYAYSSYGGLVDGRSVCEGYAEGFKVMCDKYDVPCVLVTGTGLNSEGKLENHMWNYVQMEDHKWYAVDVTWDDPKGATGVMYDYFLVGSETIAEHFDGKTFGETHKANGDFNGAGIVSFGYPELEEQKYVYEEETEPTQTPGTSETPAPSGQPAPSEPVATETPVPVVYGDLSGDGKIGAEDALLVLKAVVQLTTLDDTQKMVADVNNDGDTTAEDALLILKKVVQLIDVFPVEQQ